MWKVWLVLILAASWLLRHGTLQAQWSFSHHTYTTSTKRVRPHKPHKTRTNTSVKRGKHSQIKRSPAAKNAFKHQHPCPSTGRTSGPCRGYVIDHVTPLACGGADDPSNMQWQTVADAKAKDKWERKGCR
ncbi:MAG: HNH endonuclease signature motif containing protein [Terriglobia bacterium]